jgi:4-hydroxy 2-oxovalerate aldolase
VLVAVLERLGYDTGIDLWTLQDTADNDVRPLMVQPPTIDRDTLTLGYPGVPSSFLLRARRASESLGVDSRDILVELGRRRVVGGQEDVIFDIASGLAGSRGAV